MFWVRHFYFAFIKQRLKILVSEFGSVTISHKSKYFGHCSWYRTVLQQLVEFCLARYKFLTPLMSSLYFLNLNYSY